MNNEVLRRKLFRTVLADSRAPTGILASSPEMVETVQKRNLGGFNVTSSLPPVITQSRGYKERQGRVLPGSRGSGQVLPDRAQQFFAQIAGLPAALRAKAIKDAGLASFLSPDSLLPKKQNPSIVNRYNRNVSRDSSVNLPADDAITSAGLISRKSYTQPGDAEADQVGEFSQDQNILEAEQLMRQGDEFGNLDPETGMPIKTAIRASGDSDDLGNLPYGTGVPMPKTVAEEVSENAVSGADTISINTAKAIVPSLVEGSVTPNETKTNQGIDSSPQELKPVDPETISRGAGTETKKEKDPVVLGGKETLTGDDLMNVEGSMLTGDTDEEKAKQADEALENTGTLRDQIKERMAIQKEILGDEADLRSDANYAAMVFGLALASGTSGDFKTDLANAGKALLKMKGEQNLEKRKQNKAMALNAMNSVLEAQEKQKERDATKENLMAQLGSQEKRAILASGTQLEIARAGIRQKDRALDKNIESKEWIAQYNASNQFKIAGVKMDHDTRLAAFSAHEQLKRARLGAEVQVSIANATQENLNNRLEKQLQTQIQLAGEDSAEVQRLKFLRDNPEMQDMLIDIARKSKQDGLSFDEQLSLKLAGNDTLMLMPGGAAGLASTLKSLAKGEAPSADPATTNSSAGFDLKQIREANPNVDLSEGMEHVFGGRVFVVKGDKLVPKGS